jgi:hypothetical protein
MTNSERKIGWAATNIAQMLRDWPDMTWEDVQRVNKSVGFARRADRSVYDDGPAARMGRGRLRAVDLREAWTLAQKLAGRGGL